MSGKHKHQNQPNPATNHSSGQKETSNRHVYIEPGAKIDFVQDLREKYDSNQNKATTHFWTRFCLVSMVSINLGIRFYGVETGDAGESIEPEESQ